MSHQWEIETMHRVYDNASGTCIEIRVCPDFPGNVMLNAPDAKSADYYGPLRLSMPIEQAKKIHEALGMQIASMEPNK